MSGFSAEWLALREPADTAARSNDLAAFIASTGGPFHGRLLDLGGGTGANIRYLSSRFPSPQTWALVDDDAALIAKAPPDVLRHRGDLNRVLDDHGLFEGCAVVTASALLDLVPERWLEKLVLRAKAAGAAMLFALNYDGRIVCSPEDPDDALVQRLVNEHQKTDKGFGPALGPDAGARAIQLMTAAGYTTRQERSDWTLDPDMRPLQRELVDGWAAAAAEVSPEQKASVDAWRARRVAYIDAGRSRIVVGHLDVAGVCRA